MSDTQTKPTWTNKPIGTGYFWMRWKAKYARRHRYEVVWASQGATDMAAEVRLMTWTSIASFPKAKFCGPLENPDGV